MGEKGLSHAVLIYQMSTQIQICSGAGLSRRLHPLTMFEIDIQMFPCLSWVAAIPKICPY
jgi:hypothetical protein